MPNVRKSIEIKAPVSEVFAFMAAPEHLPEIWPSMMEVSNVKVKPDGGRSYDWIYKMAGMRFHGHSETTEVQRNRLSVVKNEKGIRSTFRWSYQGRDDTTQVTVEVDYEIPGAILGKLAEPFIRKINEREAETVLGNLKARLEEGELRAPPETQPHA
jgi:uncharacterized membrane protein